MITIIMGLFGKRREACTLEGARKLARKRGAAYSTSTLHVDGPVTIKVILSPTVEIKNNK
jgi:hypothetical protein